MINCSCSDPFCKNRLEISPGDRTILVTGEYEGEEEISRIVLLDIDANTCVAMIRELRDFLLYQTNEKEVS